MPKHLRNDRILKRPLIWLALLGLSGVLIYAFIPGESLPDTQRQLHHTASEDEPIIQIPLPEDGLSDTAQDNTAAAPPAGQTDSENRNGFVKKYRRFRGRHLYQRIINSNLNPTLIQQLRPLQRLLASDDLQQAEILYADYVKNGKSNPENSKTVAVRLQNAGKTVIYYAHPVGSTLYFYDNRGNAPEAAMDRIPLSAYERITSPFDPMRRHPITGVIRPHNGTDFKAPYGTPVHSTGKGIVSFAGIQHGYGKVVIIDHPNSYQTRYAHLSAISVTQGQSINRGETVGRLGNSGASTGAHLHYEVRLDGIPYDPMTVTLPSLKPLVKNYMAAWQYRCRQYLNTMNALAAESEQS